MVSKRFLFTTGVVLGLIGLAVVAHIQAPKPSSQPPKVLRVQRAEVMPGGYPTLNPNFEIMSDAVKAYYVRHRRLPQSLDDLTGPDGPIVGPVPEDPYAPGQPLRLRLNDAGDAVIIYSVGPDGRHDGRTYRGNLSLPPIELAELSRQYPIDLTPEQMLDDPRRGDYMRRLLAIREREGRDNAMIYYELAGRLMGSSPQTQGQDKRLARVLSEGWTGDADYLLPLLQRCQPMLAMARRGAALDYARQVEFDGLLTPAPNFLTAQKAVQLLRAEGKLLERRGQLAEALDNYLTALTIGRDHGTGDALLICTLVSYACLNGAARSLNRLVAGRHLERPLLERARDRLRQLIAGLEPVADVLAREKWLAQFLFAKAKASRGDPEAVMKEFNMSKPSKRWQALVNYTCRYPDEAYAEFERLWDMLMQEIRTPYSRRNHDTLLTVWEQKASSRSLFFQLTPNFRDVDISYRKALAALHGALLATALELYRADRSAYPERLEQLVPDYEPALPIDPFADQPYRYEPEPERRGYRLWSPGPDLTDSGGMVAYDPSKGLASPGDLILSD